jgi:rRNA maturation protein Nop10
MIAETFVDKCPHCGHGITIRGIVDREYDLEEPCPDCGRVWRVILGRVYGWGGVWAGVGWGGVRGRPRPVPIAEWTPPAA